MTPIVFMDTETTGLPLYGTPSDHPDQPHIVQLAALLVDEETKKVLQSIDLVIKPEGWVIPQDMTDIHGITHEYAVDVGVPEAHAVAIFWQLWDGRPRVGHNEPFDARIIRIALKRFFPESPELQDQWKAGEGRDTMRMAKCGLPKNKIPTMEEAYQHYVKKELKDAHNAMADTRACMDVYFAIKAGT